MQSVGPEPATPVTGVLSAIGGNISKPITGETTYTLSCITQNGTTSPNPTVTILPTFQEL